MTKLILFVSVSIFSTLCFAQEVLDSTSYEIPFLGKLGGQHIINMDFDKSSQELVINSYSNVRGGQIIANPDDLKKARDEHEEKKFFDKILSSMSQDNQFTQVILPIAQESRISADFKRKSHSKKIFYVTDNVPEDKKVYYSPSSNIASLNFEYNTGSVLEYRYTEINEVFPTFPKLNQTLLEFGNIEFKGEGMMGLKNIKPIMFKKEIIFRYDPNRGITTSPIETELANAMSLIDDENSEYISESNRISGTNTYSWYQNENKDVFKFLFYNVANESKNVLEFKFDNSRKPKVLNTPIYNEMNKKVGYLSIFGYDKRQDKKKTKFDKDQFNFVMVDLEGKILANNLVVYNNGKAYKNVLNPLYVIKKNNGKLLFANANMKNFISGKFEVCEYDIANNNLTSIKQYDLSLDVDGESMNIFDVFQDSDEVYLHNNQYIFIKSATDMNLDTRKDEIVGYNIAITDSNLNPIRLFTSRDYQTRDSSFPISYETIVKNDKELILLDKQGASFGLTKIEGEKISHTPIITSFMKDASQKDYYKFYSQKPFINDEENRNLYLINQYYNVVDQNVHMINKIGITKIAY